MKWKSLYLCTCCLFATASVLDACALETKSNNDLERSLHLFLANKFDIEAARGRKCSGGGGNRERRWGERESNNFFVKTFVFSEKGPVQFMWVAAELRALQLCLWLLCECAALCHRMWDLGSHSFSKEEGLFLAFYAHKDKKGLGQPWVSLKSALVSGNSVSTWGQGMTSVTSYQPNTSNLSPSLITYMKRQWKKFSKLSKTKSLQPC